MLNVVSFSLKVAVIWLVRTKSATLAFLVRHFFRTYIYKTIILSFFQNCSFLTCENKSSMLSFKRYRGTLRMGSWKLSLWKNLRTFTHTRRWKKYVNILHTTTLGHIKNKLSLHLVNIWSMWNWCQSFVSSFGPLKPYKNHNTYPTLWNLHENVIFSYRHESNKD